MDLARQGMQVPRLRAYKTQKYNSWKKKTKVAKGTKISTKISTKIVATAKPFSVQKKNSMHHMAATTRPLLVLAESRVSGWWEMYVVYLSEERGGMGWRAERLTDHWRTLRLTKTVHDNNGDVLTKRALSGIAGGLQSLGVCSSLRYTCVSSWRVTRLCCRSRGVGCGGGAQPSTDFFKKKQWAYR